MTLSIRTVVEQIAEPKERFGFDSKKFEAAQIRRANDVTFDPSQRLQKLDQAAEQLLPGYKDIGLDPMAVFLAAYRRRKKENDHLGMLKSLERAIDCVVCDPEALTKFKRSRDLGFQLERRRNEILLSLNHRNTDYILSSRAAV